MIYSQKYGSYSLQKYTKNDLLKIQCKMISPEQIIKVFLRAHLKSDEQLFNTA